LPVAVSIPVAVKQQPIRWCYFHEWGRLVGLSRLSMDNIQSYQGPLKSRILLR
jgi:hypothetical protein